jgi:tetratricopeptide (TPR) repeat protein
LPQAYIDRGQAHLNWGDIDGALSDAVRAATVGPRDADAFKLWGDVLVKKGKPKDALGKFNEALMYSPHWKELRVARDSAARKTF